MFLIVVIVAVFGAAVGIAGLELKRYAQKQQDPPPPLAGLVMVARPAWMPDSLASRIVTQLMPADAKYDDPKLTEDVYDRAKAHPWVASVEQVTKSSDGKKAWVRLQAKYRQAVAQAGSDGLYVFVDADGVVLNDPPDDPQVPRWVMVADAKGNKPDPATAPRFIRSEDAPPGSSVQRLHYVVIDGVTGPLPTPGQAWDSAALKDGLRLLGYVLSRPYANQITVIDVRNAGGQISASDPQLKMFAQLGQERATEIRFGRFKTSVGDYEVSPDRKMANLDRYYQEHGGKLVGPQWIELQYDMLEFSLN